MTVPKKRHSHSRQGKRRANWKIAAINLSECPNCHEKILPHRVCPSCGKYGEREVVKIETKKAETKEKKEKK